MRKINIDNVTAYLDNLLTCSSAEACRRTGIAPNTPWHWLVNSRLGHPDLQAITFCDVIAPYHVQLDNVKHLSVAMIEQSTFERARDGCYVDVFFQGVRQFEDVLREQDAGKDDETLELEYGPNFRAICYSRQPTKQWLKPSDALVTKVLESWKRKRYGAHQTIDVNYGGVLRLTDTPAPADTARPVIDVTATDVFEDEAADEAEQRGGHLALAAPAKTAEEFEARAAAGEFDQAPVTFKDADGKPASLRPDIEALRAQVAELRARGPKNPVPLDKDGRRMIDPNLSKPGRMDQADDAGHGLKPGPAPFVRPQQPAPAAPALSSRPTDERTIGTGVEGVGDGPDPERIGNHQGFRVA